MFRPSFSHLFDHRDQMSNSNSTFLSFFKLFILFDRCALSLRFRSVVRIPAGVLVGAPGMNAIQNVCFFVPGRINCFCSRWRNGGFGNARVWTWVGMSPVWFGILIVVWFGAGVASSFCQSISSFFWWDVSPLFGETVSSLFGADGLSLFGEDGSSLVGEVISSLFVAEVSSLLDARALSLFGWEFPSLFDE